MGIIHCVDGSNDARRKGKCMSIIIEAPETVESDSTEVACDGGGDLGHPRVYLNMGDRGEVECPYCDRKFVLIPGHAA
jgi:uncharacterized Zn-finger protein